MAVLNNWIGYLDRSLQQAKEAILIKLGNNLPEMTDHTQSNPFIKFLDIFLGISEILHYYIDNAAREVFLPTSRRFESAVKLAEAYDYRIRGVVSASGEVVFSIPQSIPNDLIIPIGTVVQNDSDLEYITTDTRTILAGTTSIVAPVEQKIYVPVSTIGQTDGSKSQHFLLPKDTEEGSLVVTIDGQQYSFVKTFSFSSGTELVYTTKIDSSGNYKLIFGDGLHGIIPPTGRDISVEYYTSSGSQGNVANSSITKLKTPITQDSQTVEVNNTSAISGGADIESLEDLKKSIPLSLRTLDRAVTKDDFRDIAQLQAGVLKAVAVYDCGRQVDVYIAPEGGGLASQALLDRVRDAFYDDTRLIIMDVRILSAGVVSLLIEADVEVLPQFNRQATGDLVKQNLVNEYSVSNQDISGVIHLGDVYQKIENTRGVSHSKVRLLSYIPSARIITGNSTLDWSARVLEGSTETLSYTIKYVGGAQMEYELFKGNVYLGRLELGNEINLQNVSFTVNDAGYSEGDSWEFIIYPYNEDIDLQEPSILEASVGNINLKLSGGV